MVTRADRDGRSDRQELGTRRAPTAQTRTRRRSGWAGRWRAALRIARRDAARHKGRSAVVLAMIALPVAAAIFGVATVLSSLGTPLTDFERNYPAAVEAVLVDSGCGCTVMQNPQETEAAWLDEQSGAAPLTASELGQTLPGRTLVPVRSAALTVTAGDRAAPYQPTELIPAGQLAELAQAAEGRLPQSPTEAAVAPVLAARLDLAPGDTIEVTASGRDQELQVVGILDEGTSDQGWRPRLVVATGPDGAHPLADDWLRWYVLGGEVSWADVMALNGVGVTVSSRAVLTDPPPPDQVPLYAQGYGSDSQGGLSTTAIGVGAGIAAVAFIEAVLLVGPAFGVGARRQVRELALVAAAGGARSDLRRIVVSAGVVAGLGAGLVGAVVGTGAFLLLALVQRARRDPFPLLVLPWWLVLAAVAFAVVLGTVASWLPARSATRLDVVAALAGRRAEAGSRRTGWIGLAMMVGGLVLALVAVLLDQVLLLVAGIVLLELGVVAATGGLLTLLARLAPRLPLASRFALRDAVRQRSRTVPAVAAVLAAVAAVSTGAVYLSSSTELDRAAWAPATEVGTIALMSPDWAAVSPASIEMATAAVEKIVPLAGYEPVRVLTAATMPADGAEAPGMPGVSYATAPWVEVVPPPDQRCPIDETTPPEEVDHLSETDPRCMMRSGSSFWYLETGQVLVDDGSAVAQFGFDGAEEAAAALARGEVLVGQQRDRWPDGSAHLQLIIPDDQHPEDPESGFEAEIVAPAYVVPWVMAAPILPTSLVAEYPQLATDLAGAVLRPDVPFDRDWVDQVYAITTPLGVAVQQPFADSSRVALQVLLALAAVVALSATWLSVALAAAETRPDLATLAAIGAPSSVRRRIAGAQAAVLAMIGAVGGVALGLLLGTVLASWLVRSRQEAQLVLGRGELLPGVQVPWWMLVSIVVVVPALAVAGAWITAPRRLALARRVAQ